MEAPTLPLNVMLIEGADPMDKVQSIRKEPFRRAADLEEHAREILANHSHFIGRTQAFDFEIRDDILIVRGRVPSFYLKQMLQNALKNLPGVRWIDNRVTVVSDYGVSGLEG
jgi:hypothetical protein